LGDVGEKLDDVAAVAVKLGEEHIGVKVGEWEDAGAKFGEIELGGAYVGDVGIVGRKLGDVAKESARLECAVAERARGFDDDDVGSIVVVFREGLFDHTALVLSSTWSYSSSTDSTWSNALKVYVSVGGLRA
jgi:hypothetical protein